MELFVSDLDKYPVSIEPSSSPCDPGDGHDKVKTLNDIIFTSKSAKTEVQVDGPEGWFHSGLRFIIGRGSPLDIGMFHGQRYSSHGEDGSDRIKMTIELWVLCEISSDTKAIVSDKSLGLGSFTFCLIHSKSSYTHTQSFNSCI